MTVRVSSDTCKTKCRSGKIAFRSQGAAQRALDRVAVSEQQAAVPATEHPIRAYRCGCGAWHLTSQAKRDATKREWEPRKKRRRARRKPARARALTLVPPLAPVQAPAPKAPAPAWEPSDPISGARREAWRLKADELARLNAQERLNPRRAAA